MMQHQRKKHGHTTKGDLKIFCPSQMEPALLSDIEEGRNELEKNANKIIYCEQVSNNESNITLQKTLKQDNKIFKNTISTVEKETQEKPRIYLSSDTKVYANEADRQIYSKIQITSIKALKIFCIFETQRGDTF